MLQRIIATFIALCLAAPAIADQYNVSTNTETPSSGIRCDQGHLDVTIDGDWGSPAVTVTIQRQDDNDDWVDVENASWSKSGTETVDQTINCVRRGGAQMYRAETSGGTGHDLDIGLWPDYR